MRKRILHGTYDRRHRALHALQCLRAQKFLQAMHYTGWMLKDGRPASVRLGEPEKWKKELAKEAEKKKKEEAKRQRLKNFWKSHSARTGKILRGGRYGS